MDPVTLVVASSYALLGLVLLGHAARIGIRSAPRVMPLLAILFLITGATWLVEPTLGHQHHLVTALNTGASILLLALAIRSGSIVRELARGRRRAQFASREYERALADYELLMRHRLANPLTVVVGAIDTLRNHPELPTQTRHLLLELVAQAADDLERASIRPSPASIEEQGLRPAPEGVDTHDPSVPG